MSISTQSLPEATHKPARRRAVPLWGAGVALATAAALGTWWASVPDDAVPEATVQLGAAAASAQNPRERCGGRHLVALHRCLARECEKPEVQAHRECQRLRDIEARARSALGG
jgi:hypothetical protein